MKKINELTPEEQVLAEQIGDQLRKSLHAAFIGKSSTENTVAAVKAYIKDFMISENLLNPNLNLADPSAIINGPEITISWE